jgi:hypothetical protein
VKSNRYFWNRAAQSDIRRSIEKFEIKSAQLVIKANLVLRQRIIILAPV